VTESPPVDGRFGTSEINAESIDKARLEVERLVAEATSA
jgi:hypothetical protein